MIDIRITGDLYRGVRFLDELIEFMRQMSGSRAREILAQVLEDSHKQAFREGGFAPQGGRSWEPTDPWWVAHLADKAGKGPLVWTGNAMESIHGFATSEGAAVEGVEYLEKFLPEDGSTFTETFNVLYTGHGAEDWEKLPSPDGADGKMTREISVWHREVFQLLPSQADEFFKRLIAEGPFGEMVGGYI